MSRGYNGDDLAILAYGGSEKLDKDIKYWRAEVKRRKPGTLAHDLARSTLDDLLMLKRLK